MTETTMGADLKPCPFCGSAKAEADFTFAGSSQATVFFVECFDCDARTGYHPERSQAIAAWNHRTLSPTSAPLEEGERRCPECDMTPASECCYPGGAPRSGAELSRTRKELSEAREIIERMVKLIEEDVEIPELLDRLDEAESIASRYLEGT